MQKCSQYTRCGNLHIDVDGIVDGNIYNTNEVVALARNDIGSICSDYSIARTLGYNAWLSACNILDFNIEPPSSTLNSWRESHSLVCETYNPCLFLQAIENANRAQQNLANSVFTENNIQMIYGRKDCANVYQPRNCSFTSERKTNCNTDNREWCNIFKACKVLSDLLEIFNSSGDSGRNFGKDGEIIYFSTIEFEMNKSRNRYEEQTVRRSPSRKFLAVTKAPTSGRLSISQQLSLKQTSWEIDMKNNAMRELKTLK